MSRFVLVLIAYAAFAQPAEQLYDFESGVPANLAQHNTHVTLVPHQDSTWLQVAFGEAEWPNVFFKADTPWDWNAYAAIAVDVYNPDPEPLTVSMRVDNEGADGINNCKTASVLAQPGKVTTLVARFNAGGAAQKFWGMRGVPEVGEMASGNQLDASRVVAFQVFLTQPDTPHTLLLDNIRLVGSMEALDSKVSFPFIDRFGQYKHDTWPGKLTSEDELATRRITEEQERAATPFPPQQDAIGAWLDGPQREATGWFRAENIDGVWWLITPQGRLFFSLGMDCVNTGDHTFVSGRDAWFEDMPPKDDPAYGRFYGHTSNVHSMAEAIGGEGDTFQFYAANLRRKYGENWFDAWRDASYERLRHWGFNTFGAWCDGNVTNSGPLPFTVSLGSGRAGRNIEGARGYWGHLVDVYDPKFAESTNESLAKQIEPYKDNPLCVGYFVDNEIGWETIRSGTLASPVDQPCRMAFIETLKTKYGNIASLNAAWETHADEWDSLRNPDRWNDTSSEDIGDFVHAFARMYFETIRDALREHAPNHLYLGCRFATAPPQAVQACAEIADVISFNLYYHYVPCEKYTGEHDLGKPLMIGEFHFGALDRGMFHTGLRGAPDQATRAQYFHDYVKRVVECPSFVGCHWFQYVDEPTTGRTYDGENYAIGFVSITDTPYPEMVDAAQAIAADMYALRAAKAAP